MGGASNNVKGLALAISSSIFIGSSLIIKKVGLKKAGASGTPASDGGCSYVKEPIWWIGMITMFTGEVANFAAYAYAPAILVTPMGALTIIFCAVLAHFILKERLNLFGVVGCVICLVGSVVIAIHAPLEKDIHSVKEIWHLATQPGFLIYAFSVIGVVIFLIWYERYYGETPMVVYIGICSLIGSLTVMTVKVVVISLKLSFSGSNQFVYYQPWICTALLVVFTWVQVVYLNKALDLFNTAVVSPVYYVMFTGFTVLSSTIMFKGWNNSGALDIVGEICGFATILCGVFLLHKTKDMGASSEASSPQLPTTQIKHSDQVILCRS